MNIVERLNNEVWATLKPSLINGIGVVAIRFIPKGTEIAKCEDNTQYYEVSDEEFLQILEPIRNMILDRTQFEKIRFRHPNCMAKLQSFMNHSNEPNSDGKVALRDIKEGEEITENFMELNKNLHPLILKRYLDEGIL